MTPPGQRRDLDPRIALAAFLLLLFAAYCAGSLTVAMQRPELHRFGDFIALWSSAKIAFEGHPALNYDAAGLHGAQVALGMDPADQYPFPYPPFFLAVLAPLGALGYSAAFATFMALTFAAYLWAAGWDRLRAAPWLAAAAILPTSAINIVAGQTGFLSGALALGALRLLATRPLLAGALMGALSFKPQLALLMPVAALASGRWRALLGAAATVLLLAALSGLALGWSLWPIWLNSLADYSERFASHSPPLRLMPTVAAATQMIGASRNLAWLAQGLAFAAVVALVWREFARAAAARASMALLVGTFLATPHALVYDLTLMSVGAIWLLEEDFAVGRAPNAVRCLIVGCALLMPAVMRMPGTSAPVALPAFAALFAAILLAPRTNGGNGLPSRTVPPPNTL